MAREDFKAEPYEMTEKERIYAEERGLTEAHYWFLRAKDAERTVGVLESEIAEENDLLPAVPMKQRSMRVNFSTNLDLWHAERWPTDIPGECRPQKGDRIQSLHEWGGGRRLELEVTSVSFRQVKNRNGSGAEYVTEIFCELHMPSWMGSMSIQDFENWYKKLMGRV